MCGICGLIYSDRARPVDRQTLARMTNIMQYRGPDRSLGFHVEPGMGLGVRRLSIIDLKTGDQPISNENGAVTVICNGEIYNFLELRHELMAAGHRFRTSSDVEVIVHLYEDLGPECVHRLRGMFGFAIWDSHRRLLMLARDRLGIKPLYYTVGAEGVSFGSEIKPILVAYQLNPRWMFWRFKIYLHLDLSGDPGPSFLEFTSFCRGITFSVRRETSRSRGTGRSHSHTALRRFMV